MIEKLEELQQLFVEIASVVSWYFILKLVWFLPIPSFFSMSQYFTSKLFLIEQNHNTFKRFVGILPSGTVIFRHFSSFISGKVLS